MESRIEDVFARGLVVWRRNLVLGLPFFLRAVINLFVLACFAAFVFFLANPFSNASYVNALSFFRSVNWVMLVFDLALLCFIALFLWVVSCFFAAGSIGMCDKALSEGKTGLDDLFFYGKKNFMRVFVAESLITFLAVICIIVLFFLQALLNGEYIRLFMVFAGIVFEPIPYAIVLGNTGVREGIKKGVNAALDNKFEAVLTYVFTTCFSSVVSIAALMVVGVMFSFILIAMPVQEYSKEGVVAALGAGTPLIILGLVAAIIIFWLFTLFVASPVTAITWTGFYRGWGRHE